MPSLAEVNRTFPESVQAFEAARAAPNGWKGDDYWEWLDLTIQRNPNHEWARYASFGQVPEGRADPIGEETAAASAEKSYEQELFDQVNEQYIQPDIAEDANRRTLADQLTQQATTDYQTARDLAGQSIGPSFNADAYFAANPDVAEAYARMGADASGRRPTAREFAQNHYDTYGRAEGRTGAEFTSRLQRELVNADQTGQAIAGSAGTASTQQIAALEQQIAAMRASQDVNQIARADALQQQVDALRSNIDTRSNDQIAALDQEIASLGQNLDAESRSRVQALQTQRDALTNNLSQFGQVARDAATTQSNDRWQVLSGEYRTREDALNKQLNNQGAAIDTRASSQLSGLQAEIAAMRGSLDQSQQTKADALEAQLNSLTANIDSYDSAQQAALTQEITKLAAAQLPVSQARIQQADNLVTAINVGLEDTRDRFDANQAAQGFIGGSSMASGNLARAVVGARQQAAQVMGDARVANATDDRSINSRGATEGRSISDATSGNRFSLGQYGANSRFGNAVYGADEARRLTDELASGSRSINDLSAQERYALDTYGNKTAYDTTTYIAGEGRKIGEETAADMRGIADSANVSRRGILDNFINTEYGNNLSTAAQNRAIADTGATQRRSLADTLATDRAAVGTYGANTAFADRVMGANDTRTLANTLATNRAGIANNLTIQQQAARDAATGQKNAYFDQDYTRQQGTALTLPSLTTNYTNSVGALDQYRNAGLNRSLGTLDWWSGNSTAPNSQTAQYQAYVDQSGANIAGLGTGLLGAAVNIGNSNSWWQKPKTATTTPTGSGSNSAALSDVTNWGAVA